MYVFMYIFTYVKTYMMKKKSVKINGFKLSKKDYFEIIVKNDVLFFNS